MGYLDLDEIGEYIKSKNNINIIEECEYFNIHINYIDYDEELLIPHLAYHFWYFQNGIINIDILAKNISYAKESIICLLFLLTIVDIDDLPRFFGFKFMPLNITRDSPNELNLNYLMREVNGEKIKTIGYEFLNMSIDENGDCYEKKEYDLFIPYSFIRSCLYRTLTTNEIEEYIVDIYEEYGVGILWELFLLAYYTKSKDLSILMNHEVFRNLQLMTDISPRLLFIIMHDIIMMFQNKEEGEQ